VVLAGATVSTAADYAQLIDQDGMAKALGCGIQRFRSPQHLAEDLVTAFRRAAAERRPIVFSVPVDHQDAEVGGPNEVTPPPSLPALLPAPDAVRHVVDLVHDARRPVLLCGWGAYLADARSELLRLGDAAGALLATTATAKGFFTGEPFDVGTSGGFASEAAARLLQEADLVLAFGASLNNWTTRSNTLYPAATVVHVDDDPSAIGAHRRQVLPVLGDVRLTAAALADELAAAPRTDAGYRTSEIRAAIEEFGPGDPYEDAGTADTIDPRTLTIALGTSLPQHSVVVTDSGAFMGFPGSYLTVRRPGGFLFPQAFQSVGLGLAHTIGAGLARENDLPVSLIGDGGLLMSLGELETIVRLGRPHLVVVYNDSAYGAEIHIGAHHGLRTDIVHFPDADFADVARAMGGSG
jgi:thiamine pyrophosphate-dependent acetolactate synthase large subunit-like protein